MSSIGHKAILASAGSGKTFQLAHRYIQLLAEKDTENKVTNPDRICAMTFTRKAAGEIFDEIANYLRMAASDEEAAALTSTRIENPQLKKDEYLKMLRRFIDNLHRARIGTFDSFIVGIAKAFPVELGIPMNFQVMDTSGAAAKENRQRILNHILGSTDAVSKTFLEAFKQATYGHEIKTIEKVLDDFLTKLNSLYRLCPDETRWGNDAAIWPGGSRPFATVVKCDGQAILADVTTWHGQQDLSNKRTKTIYDSILDITKKLAEFTPASSAADLIDNKQLQQMMTGLEDMKLSGFEISYYKKAYGIPLEISGKLADLIHNMLVIEYDRILLQTVGLFRLLDTYESVYQEITRATGSFSFTDIQYLLAGPEKNAPHISREQGTDRLYIDYRMDCQLDHWLLDEFQDTSDLQWGVFENLIEEIVSAESGRSFFYVGDIKQAIYSWRGGNHELFHKILDKHNPSEGAKAIHDTSIQQTYRCSQPVIDTVNKVFGNLPETFPEPTVKKWSEQAWKDHETVSPTKESGYVALLDLPPKPGEKSEEMRYQLVADLLNDIQPVKRGLKVGILVRGNDFGKELVNLLSKECKDMSFVHEGESGVAENEVAALLLAMVKSAAHPGDEYAWKYIQMTPMAEVLMQKKINQSNISANLIAEMLDDGLQAFIRNWGEQLAAVCDLGAYGLDCLNRLESAAAEFDTQGTPDINAFLNYIEHYTIREQPSSKAVRVMTIHQSKGLEFDVVILPELQSGQNSNMIVPSSPQLICAGERAEPDWILKAPKKIISENDPVLNAQLEEAGSRHSYDSLCVLYVAMTRARHGMYLITSGYKSETKTMHPSVFLKTQLVGEPNPKATPNIKLNGRDYTRLYECGTGSTWYEKDWPLQDSDEASDKALTLAKGFSKKTERRKLLSHREPSRQNVMTRNASTLFEARSADIMNFGSAIHEMFEQVEWAEDADIDKIISEWEPGSIYEVDVTKDAITQFRNCMESDTVRKCLSKPDGATEPPWCEKRFEVILDDEFVSGAFDRVVIVRDKAGKPVSAEISDYKSSLVDTEHKMDEKVKDYTPQMHTYRDALSLILGLDSKKITLNLIFTKQQVVKQVL